HAIARRAGAPRLPSLIGRRQRTGAAASASAPPLRWGRKLTVKRVERFLEGVGMRLFGLGEGLEPFDDLLEAFFARVAGHPRIHVGVFVGFPCDRRDQILRCVADRLAGHGIANLLEILEVTMGAAGLTLAVEWNITETSLNPSTSDF